MFRKLGLMFALVALILPALALHRQSNAAGPCTTEADPTVTCPKAKAEFPCEHWQPSGEMTCISKMTYDCTNWKTIDLKKGWRCRTAEESEIGSECVQVFDEQGRAKVKVCCKAYKCKWTDMGTMCTPVASPVDDIPNFYYETQPCIVPVPVP